MTSILDSCKYLRVPPIGPTIEQPITCVAAQGDFTFVGCGADIIVYERVSEVSERLE